MRLCTGWPVSRAQEAAASLMSLRHFVQYQAGMVITSRGAHHNFAQEQAVCSRGLEQYLGVMAHVRSVCFIASAYVVCS